MEGDGESVTLKEWKPPKQPWRLPAQGPEYWKWMFFSLGSQLGHGGLLVFCTLSSVGVGVLGLRLETLQWELQPPCYAHLAWPLILKFFVTEQCSSVPGTLWIPLWWVEAPGNVAFFQYFAENDILSIFFLKMSSVSYKPLQPSITSVAYCSTPPSYSLQVFSEAKYLLTHSICSVWFFYGASLHFSWFHQYSLI